MVKVNTVTGEVDSSELGFTLIHEHMRTRSEALAFQFPRLYDEEHEFQMALQQVRAAKKLGVKTICDPTVYGLGRDIKFIERVSVESGVQIVAATGLFTFHYLPTRFAAEDIDYMAEQFIKDIEEGIQNTSIKAGFLKCATDEQGLTEGVEKVLRAVARAQINTNVPIMTHSHAASETGLLQLDVFADEGVDLNNVLIGHCGDSDDLDYIISIINRGAYVGLDRYGLTSYLSTEKRNEVAMKLLDKGFENRLFLSQDYCCTTDRYKPESVKKAVYPKWSMTYLLEEVIPVLKEMGMTDEHLEIIMVKNATAWFSGK